MNCIHNIWWEKLNARALKRFAWADTAVLMVTADIWKANMWKLSSVIFWLQRNQAAVN
jgi:hypothetical protein